MTVNCPDCGQPEMMRAVQVVRFKVRGALAAWLLGPVEEEVIGFNAVCARVGCGCMVRVEKHGIRRLHPKVAAPAENGFPPEPEKPKPGITLHRTPGMEWSRGSRD